MIVGGLALIGVAIKLVAMRSKTKYLMKNGIVLKNLKFKTTKRTPAFTYALIEHIDGEGNPCVFKGILPTNVVRDKDICDVAVDPNNYKKYLIRYNIF